MIKIAQGAEAILMRDKTRIIKERVSKSYRLPQLDESLRKFRTRREAKILGKLEEMKFPSPHLQEFSDKRMSIVMDFVPGATLRDVLMQGDEYQMLAKEVGEKVGRLHAANIVHGDLTTSNMIQHAKSSELHIIDFGLSSFSEKVEDKAVDLFLLERALESTHYDKPEMFLDVLKGYTESNPDAAAVLARLRVVQGRGRNKKN
jgi:TP53 regulating kinase and related kinases